jgi:hypothetical protein
MATNPPPGKGRRGTVKKRAQVFNRTLKRFIKVNTDTGRFMDQRSKKSIPFKGVRKK